MAARMSKSLPAVQISEREEPSSEINPSEWRAQHFRDFGERGTEHILQIHNPVDRLGHGVERQELRRCSSIRRLLSRVEVDAREAEYPTVTILTSP